MNKNLRWTEQQLKQHQNMHQNRKNAALQQQKQENDAKVRQAVAQVLNRNTTQNTNDAEKVILDCEILAVPPSVNHYWEKSGRGFKLSDKARDFHDLIAMLVPQMNTDQRLKLDVTFHFPNRLRRDIDNYLKATIDSLVKCGLCVDDEQFDELIVRRGNVIKGGLIRLKVSEISGACAK